MTETDLLAAAYPGHVSPPDYEFATNRSNSMRYRAGRINGHLGAASGIEAAPRCAASVPSDPIKVPSTLLP